MLALGTYVSGRVRPGCAGASCVARRGRRVLIPTYAPLRRKWLLEAKRGGRSAADADAADGEEGGPSPAAAGGAEPWRQQMEGMTFRDMQVALRTRGLSAGGTRAELETRLAEALRAEQQQQQRGTSTLGSSSSSRKVQQQRQQQEDEEEEEEWEEEEEDVTGPSSSSGRQQEQQDSQQQRLEVLLEELEEVPYGQLKSMCAERGLSGAGKKAELQQRLAEAILQEEEEEEAEEEQERPPAASPPSAPSPESLLPELLSLPTPDLIATLREYGEEVPVTRGSPPKRQLATRLAELMVAEVAAELSRGGQEEEEGREEGQGEEEEEYEEEEDEGEWEYGDEEGEEAEEDEEEEAPSASKSGSVLDPGSLSMTDRRLLLAGAMEDLRAAHATKTRQQLFGSLKRVRPGCSYQSREVLMDQLVRAEGEEALEAELQAAASDPAAASRLRARLASLRSTPSGGSSLPRLRASAPAPRPPAVEAADYASLTPADVRRMRVEDLRAALAHFGLDSSGTKYEMVEKLMARVRTLHAARKQARQAEKLHARQERQAERMQRQGGAAGAAAEEEEAEASAAPAAAAFDHVLGMTLRSLREELDARGLPTGGGRSELQARLIGALRGEAEAARRLSPELKAAAAAGLTSESAAAGGEPAEPYLLTPGAAGEPEEALGASASSLAAGDLDSAAAASSLAVRAMSPRARLAAQLVRAAEGLGSEAERAAALAVTLAGGGGAGGGGLAAELLVLAGEPAVDVAVVGGCVRGRIDLAAQSLAACRAVLDHLHSAPLTSPAAAALSPDLGPMLAEAEAEEGEEAEEAEEREQEAEGEEAEEGEEGQQEPEGEEEEAADTAAAAAPLVGGVPRHPTGAVVSVWWLDGTTGRSFRLSPAQVYAASPAELAAGVFPAVHPGLLAVPPPSPLSLDTPDLLEEEEEEEEEQEEEASKAQEGGAEDQAEDEEDEDQATSFPDVSSLAAHLAASCHVVLPAVPAGGAQWGALQAALAGAGAAVVGSGAREAEAAQDRVGVLSRLSSLHYPVVPLLELGPGLVAGAVREAARQAEEAEAQREKEEQEGAQREEQEGAKKEADKEVVEEEEAEEEEEEKDPVVAAAEVVIRDRVLEWCKEQSLDPSLQLFLLRPRHSAGASSAADTRTALGAERVAELL
ncbi:hypothetical protein Agub_g12256, partial [Astrephomene gubernaculifera]